MEASLSIDSSPRPWSTASLLCYLMISQLYQEIVRGKLVFEEDDWKEISEESKVGPEAA